MNSDDNKTTVAELRKIAAYLEDAPKSHQHWAALKAANLFFQQAAAGWITHVIAEGWLAKPGFDTMFANARSGWVHWLMLRAFVGLGKENWAKQFDTSPPRRINAPRHGTQYGRLTTGTALDAPYGELPQGDGDGEPSDSPPLTDEELHEWYTMQALGWSRVLALLASIAERSKASDQPEQPAVDPLTARRQLGLAEWNRSDAVEWGDVAAILAGKPRDEITRQEIDKISSEIRTFAKKTNQIIKKKPSGKKRQSEIR